MAITLGQARYGKAETRVVRVRRDGDRHEIEDLNVSVALGGDLADTYLTGDSTKVLPTDSQRNTVYAFAQERGIDEIEDFALLLARHFVGSQPPIRWARVAIEEYRWERVSVGGSPAPHSFARTFPFGRPNGNEVYVAADRPYGLIEGTVLRDDAPPAGEAW